jgi:hypothetical protein
MRGGEIREMKIKLPTLTYDIPKEGKILKVKIFSNKDGQLEECNIDKKVFSSEKNEIEISKELLDKINLSIQSEELREPLRQEIIDGLKESKMIKEYTPAAKIITEKVIPQAISFNIPLENNVSVSFEKKGGALKYQINNGTTPSSWLAVEKSPETEETKKTNALISNILQVIESKNQSQIDKFITDNKSEIQKLSFLKIKAATVKTTSTAESSDDLNNMSTEELRNYADFHNKKAQIAQATLIKKENEENKAQAAALMQEFYDKKKIIRAYAESSDFTTKGISISVSFFEDHVKVSNSKKPSASDITSYEYKDKNDSIMRECIQNDGGENLSTETIKKVLPYLIEKGLISLKDLSDIVNQEEAIKNIISVTNNKKTVAEMTEIELAVICKKSNDLKVEIPTNRYDGIHEIEQEFVAQINIQFIDLAEQFIKAKNALDKKINGSVITEEEKNDLKKMPSIIAALRNLTTPNEDNKNNPLLGVENLTTLYKNLTYNFAKSKDTIGVLRELSDKTIKYGKNYSRIKYIMDSLPIVEECYEISEKREASLPAVKSIIDDHKRKEDLAITKQANEKALKFAKDFAAIKSEKSDEKDTTFPASITTLSDKAAAALEKIKQQAEKGMNKDVASSTQPKSKSNTTSLEEF